MWVNLHPRLPPLRNRLVDEVKIQTLCCHYIQARDGQTNRQTDRRRQIQREALTNRPAETATQLDTERQTGRDRQRLTHSQRQRARNRKTDGQTDRDGE